MRYNEVKFDIGGMSPQPPPPRLSGLCLFVAAYVSLFAIAGVVLFGPGLLSPRTTSELHSSAASSSPSVFTLPLLNQDGLQWPYPGKGQFLNCSSLKQVSGLEFVAGGWTKAVYRARYGDRDLAIKTVNLNGHDVKECQARGEPVQDCYSRAAAKLMREMILLTELRHENMIKVLGSCVPASQGPVAVVTELGEPLDTVRLLQLPWEDRLQLAVGVAKILRLLANSPLGSLAMNDFRRQQFVVLDGVLKLSDVDDLGLEEPTCSSDADCFDRLPQELPPISQSCVGGRCHGHNERVNIWRAGKHFIKQFLPLGAPDELQLLIAELLSAYNNATWGTSRILEASEELVRVYSTGEYLRRQQLRPLEDSHVLGFEIIEGQDLPGNFDYSCSDSRSAVTCVRSVHDVHEAAQLCNKDPKCKVVVLQPTRTWTGRTLAVFKSGFGSPSSAPDYKLLLRRQP